MSFIIVLNKYDEHLLHKQGKNEYWKSIRRSIERNDAFEKVKDVIKYFLKFQ